MESDRDYPRLTGKPEVNCRQQAIALRIPPLLRTVPMLA